MAIAKTWVFAELLDGKPVPAVLELLTKARSLGGTVEAVAFGPDAEAAAAVLGDYGATTLHAGTDAAYGELLPGGPVGDAIATLVGEHHPDLILIASTYAGRDIAGRLAAKLDVPVIAHGLDVAGGDAGSVQRRRRGGRPGDRHHRRPAPRRQGEGAPRREELRAEARGGTDRRQRRSRAR